MRTTNILMLAASSALAAWTTAAAQTTTPGAATAAPAAAGVGATEIVVTAQKRKQSINTVGATLTALDSKTLATQKIASLTDVAQAVPSLTFAMTNNNTPVLTLRGIGFYDSSLAVYPAVSVYIDEAPLPFPILSTLTAFDLERIEVLKGPQGTLFGQNSTGGALNYIAAKPTNTFVAGGDLSYGRFNAVDGNGYMSGPISDTVSARLALHVVHSDDWQHSYTRNDTAGGGDSFAGRLLIDWRPTDKLRFSLDLNGWDDKTDPEAAQYVFANPQQPAFANPAVLAYPKAPNDSQAADWSPNVRPRADNRFYQAFLRGDYDIAPGVTLTSLTSYVHFKLDQVPEGDGTAFNILDVRSDVGSVDSITQELRIANSGGARFRWVFGGNYEHSKVDETFINDFSDSSTPPALGIRTAGASSKQTMQNYAVFGNAEYDIFPSVTLKAGARFTEADRTSVNCAFDTGDGLTNGFFTVLGRLLTGNPNLPALQPGQCYNLNAQFVPGAPFVGRLNESNVSWRVGADYKPARNILLYANISQGYKAGSFPTLAAATTSQYAPVKQESVLAYEGGVKAGLFDRRLQANAAVYYYDYSNKQLKSKEIDPIFGILDALVNIPKTVVDGAEVELTAQPTGGLKLRGAVTYTDAHISKYRGVNAAGVVADFAGADVPFTPRWQGRIDADYRWTLQSGLSPFVGAGISAQSGAYSIVGGERVDLGGRKDLYRLNGRALLDLRAGISGANDAWSLTLFGRNVTNSFYVQNVSTDSDAIVRYVGRPATYGVTFSVRYH